MKRNREKGQKALNGPPVQFGQSLLFAMVVSIDLRDDDWIENREVMAAARFLTFC